MAYTYNYELNQFPNDKCDNNKFSDQIRNSSISAALDYLSQSLGFVTCVFKAELTTQDTGVLDDLVANHDGEPIPDDAEIVKTEILTEHIRYVEKGDTTQGLYAAESLIVDVSAGTEEEVVDFSWPYPVALMSGTLGVSTDMIGDDIMIEVGPNTLVGALTQPLNVGDTSIYVSSTVIENVKKGYYINLYTPGEGIEISRVNDIDEGNSCLTISPSDVSANISDYVSMTPKIIPRLFLHSMDKIEIGKQIPTGRRIPSNVPIRVHYFNNNSTSKKVSFFIEYLY